MSSLDIEKIDRKTCEDAMQLIRLYYEVIDRRRERLGFMYAEGASLVWNGNSVNGSQAIGKFLTEIPDTQHEVISVDVQRFSPLAAAPFGGDAMTALIAGGVIIDGIYHSFTQSMLLMRDPLSEKSMILSDRFRYVD
ncbi:unnamed protein product, partial [Mesorhabditis belari]|uniref:NTF2-related export protein n=1 Tax=Mesorhabditis belari TaxID=2138241 RepID=A0AAF3J5C7_9BILA